ncbi:putative N-acetylglucosaminyldiphosphoundecaprenol N-acetyl-beta-D-mannosaminyltransferase [Oxalobacteraceae bacterium IMCC9480]|nr:putative N-acetylglucosaminyldiphosphoundecaprenol N-acetyl-beta-D-mannosaminyltransferase [Oxalobacteraceae bacterium IMCC9480]
MTASESMQPESGGTAAINTSPQVVTNFQRKVVCILGLPFDAVSMAQAQAEVSDAIRSQRRCFLSTPNLNFLMASQSDTDFRDSVIRSDLSVADGMPIIWMARLLGLPLPERVAGSTLFDRLRCQAALPIKVFFFGAPDGVAAKAGVVLNQEQGRMTCVGARSPGFGTIAEMSTPALIDEINAAQPDFLVVALGAKRGQAWIEHNLARLEVPVVSHLGAVVNFVAGSIEQAPEKLGRSGLEWLWRIKEEPELWRRYRDDGVAFIRILITHVIPCAWFSMRARSRQLANVMPVVSVAHGSDCNRITLEGDWHAGNLQPLRDVLTATAAYPRDVELDLSRVTGLDAATIGLLLLLFGYQSLIKRRLQVISVSETVKYTLKMHRADYLLVAAA